MKHCVATGTFVVVCGIATSAQQAPVERPVEPIPLTVSYSAAQVEGRAAVERALTVVESRVTTARPYSAEATTEFVQVLGDGNRINRKTTVRVYRDSDGRTRRDEYGSGDTPMSITIYDPVAHTSYVLDPVNRTAQKSAIRTVTATFRRQVETVAATAAGAGGRGGAVASTTPEVGAQKVEGGPYAAGFVAGSASASGTYPTAVAPAGRNRGGAGVGRRSTPEQLGQQMVGGVMATGTRTTTVIPAGQIGNEQEIKIVSEQWMSDDLQVLVMTKHSDPRSGETTYRLTNIVRAEPAAGLFDVPADYTIKEASSYMRTPQLQ